MCFDCNGCTVFEMSLRNNVEDSLLCALSFMFFTAYARIQLPSSASYWERIELLSVTNECDNTRCFVGHCQASEQFCHHLCHTFMSRGRAHALQMCLHVIFSQQYIK